MLLVHHGHTDNYEGARYVNCFQANWMYNFQEMSTFVIRRASGEAE